MLNDNKPRLRPRERDAIIQSLRAGVTPRTGLQHIQVGRVREIEALLKDIERVTRQQIPSVDKRGQKGRGSSLSIVEFYQFGWATKAYRA